MTLKKREKIFAAIVASLLVVLAVYMIWPSGEDSLEGLRAKIASLDTFDKRKTDIQSKDAAPLNLDTLLEKIKNKKIDVQNEAARLKKDTDRLPALLRRSLPSNTEAAKRAYQNWLRDLAKEKFKSVPSLIAQEPQELTYNDKDAAKTRRTIYVKFHFTIKCQGTLEQLTRFLFDFYSAGHLHKICSINITPQKDRTQLDLNIAVDALSLPGSKQNDQLSTEKSNRLKLASLDAYNNKIVKRNPFVAYTPRNTDPRGGAPSGKNQSPAIHLSDCHSRGRRSTGSLAVRTNYRRNPQSSRRRRIHHRQGQRQG